MTDLAHESSPTMPAAVGETLDDRFEVLAVLGEGGMGHVFRVHDRDRGWEVALKLIIPRYLGRQDRERRFLQERELSARVGRHPNLVQVIESGRLERDGWPYLVMELVSSEDLGIHLAAGALPPHRAALVARQVAGALRALHKAHVVHRDVNSMNIVMAGDHAVLIDLSHAGDAAAPRVAVGRSGRLTGPNEVPGTHHYMPPEQAWAAPPEPAMDVFAFGVTMVHMLTGHAPRGCDRETYLELAREGKVVPPRVDVRIYRAVPPALAELAHSCTATAASDRPTIEQVVERLDEILAAMLVPRVEEVTALVPRARPAIAASIPTTARPSTSTLTPVALALTPAQRVQTPEQASDPDAPQEGVNWRRAAAIVAVVFFASIVVLALIVRSMDVDPPRVDRPPVGRTDDAPEVPETQTQPSAIVVEPEPEPAPVVEPNVEDRPTSTPQVTTTSEQPRVRPAAKRPARRNPSTEQTPADDASSPQCREHRDAAAAAKARGDWKDVLAQTAKAKCWPSAGPRQSLRVQAFAQLDRHEACVEAAKGSTDTMVLRLARLCKAALPAP
ncbi:MAG: protein kinase [Nannocystaceae bacterium]